MNKENRKLLDETMMTLSDRLKLISKKTISDIKNLDTADENGEYYFYFMGNEENHMFKCWFSHDRNRPVLRCKSGDENYRNLRLRFPKNQIKKRTDREDMVFWLVETIFADRKSERLLTEEELAVYFIDNMGFSIPFSKCFTVQRTSDNKPYTGAKGEEPFVGYHSRYMEQMNHYGDEQTRFFVEHDNLMRVVKEKCKDLGFTLQPEQNGIAEIRITRDVETNELTTKDHMPYEMQISLDKFNDFVRTSGGVLPTAEEVKKFITN